MVALITPTLCPLCVLCDAACSLLSCPALTSARAVTNQALLFVFWTRARHEDNSLAALHAVMFAHSITRCQNVHKL